MRKKLKLVSTMILTILTVLLSGCLQTRHDSEPPALFIKEVRVSQDPDETFYRAFWEHIECPQSNPYDVTQDSLRLYTIPSSDITRWDDHYRKGLIMHENFHLFNARRDFALRFTTILPFMRRAYDWRNEQEAYKCEFDYLHSVGASWSLKSAQKLAQVLSSDGYKGMVDYETALVFSIQIMRINENKAKPGTSVIHDDMLLKRFER